MEAVSVGAWSLLPPLAAIVLALVTKEVVAALLLGILSGTLLYSLAAGLNPVVGPVETAFGLMADSADMDILLFLALLGALVAVTGMAGGTSAYGKWAASRLRSPRAAMTATGILGALIFIDDYFNCLTVGTVMRPVTDKFHVSRAKLAYIIDATAAPVCILAPISSWAAAVGSSLKETGVYDNEFTAFISTIPYNLYAILSLVLVFTLCLTNLDFGPMLKAKEQTDDEAGEKMEDVPQEYGPSSARGRVFDMLLPVAVLIVLSVLAMLYTGGLWGTDPRYHALSAAFANCDAARSLVMGGFGALAAAFLLFVPRRLVGFHDFMKGLTLGVRSMVPAFIILLLAWTMGGVCRDLLSTGQYVGGLLAGSNVPVALLPVLVFAAAGLLAFSMGTAWGTFGILIPLVVPVCTAMAPEQLTACLSAVLAGSVFGDHCSPISDTTILSATGAGCGHLRHVSTQLAYALTAAACCVPGYVAAGLWPDVAWLPLAISLPLLLLTVFLLHRLSSRSKSAAA